MKPLKPLPPNRTIEQLHHHYLLEKSIAEKLKIANREERKLIYATMYDELFKEVPDHPRLTRRENEQQTQAANKEKLALVREFLNPSVVFAEFAPGDCRFALEVAKYVKTAYAIDISDQRSENSPTPNNFTLIVYDGYQLNGIPENSVNLMFSDQFIEHLHPEDTRAHFDLAYHILKPGGKYIVRTPHAITGPHDISKYFSYEPEGFHLKEWTYIEFKKLLKELNFSHFSAIWQLRGLRVRLPFFFFEISDRVLNLLPRKFKRFFGRYLVPTVCLVATK